MLQKLDDLNCDFLETHAWHSHFQSCQSLQEAVSCTPTVASRRVFGISQIYFPRMRNLAGEYSNELINHYIWGLHCFEDAQQESRETLGTHLGLNHRQEHQERGEKIRRLVGGLDAAIEREAQACLNKS